MHKLVDEAEAIDPEWGESVAEEILLAIPTVAKDSGEGRWIWSGEVSDLYRLIFSPEWKNHMYDEYPAYFWKDVHIAMGKRNSPTEIRVDMVYQFGAATESSVREYMEKHKDGGNRFLVMPRRVGQVSMAAAYLRGFKVQDIDTV